jgi:hypothetical protein
MNLLNEFGLCSFFVHYAPDQHKIRANSRGLEDKNRLGENHELGKAVVQDCGILCWRVLVEELVGKGV